LTDLTNSAEGGSSGTTLTTGNSGGTSGSAFDIVTPGSGATLAFDNAQAAHGSLSYKVATSATSASNVFGWSTSIGSSATMWFRAYLYMTGLLAADTRLVRFFTGTTTDAAVWISASTGILRFVNSAATNIFFMTNAVPTNQWFRIEGFVIGNATTGQVELKQFNTADSTTATETKTSAATAATNAAVDSVTFGVTQAAASIGPYWTDDLGVSNTGYLGPAQSAQDANVILLPSRTDLLIHA
jgi:hypothetical protein